MSTYIGMCAVFTHNPGNKNDLGSNKKASIFMLANSVFLLGGETSRWIRAWSLIVNKKQLFRRRKLPCE
jgi:hypothetical protein